MTSSRRMLAVLLLAGLFLSGCGVLRTGSADHRPDSSSPAIAGSLTVLAAASLTESFTTIGHDFETTYPGTKITFSFGSSSTLATQVSQGAPADVFAAANEATMKTVTDAAESLDPADFATNTLEIAVPPGNPGKITGLADFADADKKIALCAPQVPCGSAAEEVFRLAGVKAKPDTLEQDVKAAVQKVQLDEVDAALVYRTDVVAAGGKVDGIAFPQADRVVNSYPICALRAAQNESLAAAFVGYVLSPAGQQVLKEAGFGKP